MKKYITLLLLLLLPLSKSFAIGDFPVAVDSRIKTFIYSQNEIFNIKFRLGYQSIIELSDTETPEVISLGNPYVWNINPIDRRIFIKPTEPGAKTNMVIITNKRIYYLEIESDMGQDVPSSDVIYVVRFFYPNQEIDGQNITFNEFKKNIIKQSGKSRSDEKIIDYKSRLNVSENFDDDANIVIGDNQNFKYSLNTNTSPITPLEVFDDGRYTFIRFADTDFRPEMRTELYNGELKKLQYKFDSGYFVVNGIHSNIMVSSGTENVTIYNDNMDQ